MTRICHGSPNEGQPEASVLTPRGRGAIATIRVKTSLASRFSANSLPFKAANGRELDVQRPGQLLFGTWGSDVVEEVVIGVIDSGILEIHCHGGEAAASRILADLVSVGCVVEGWLELLRSGSGLLDAELQEELSRATTLRTASLLLEQANGLLRGVLESIGADFDVASARISGLLEWANFGRHLTRPWKVVLAGRPNVGKSSLINTLLGYTRAVVSDQPGTTRDTVTALTAIDGWPIELTDTAGIRQSLDLLETAGIQRAREILAEADLQILLVDVSSAPASDDLQLLADYPQAIVVGHKCDLPTFAGIGGWDRAFAANWRRVSSKTGEGIETLLRAISERLVPRMPEPGTPLPITLRQIALLRRAQDAARQRDLAAMQDCLRELIGAAPACLI